MALEHCGAEGNACIDCVSELGTAVDACSRTGTCVCSATGAPCESPPTCTPSGCSLNPTGAACTADDQCALGTCECGDAACSADLRVCAIEDCNACRYSDARGLCTAPTVASGCIGKECGPDACGGTCGACVAAEDLCVDGTCVCQQSNGGVEICDEVDNDCDGQADEDETRTEQYCYEVEHCCILIGGSCGDSIPGSSCWCCDIGPTACCSSTYCAPRTVYFTCN
jgi:hypothetical protein